VEVPLFPLSFAEFRNFQAAGTSGLPNESVSFTQFLKFGGFPGLHRMEFQEEAIFQYLTSLADSVLLKDVIMRHKVRDTALLRSLLLFLADNCGSIFSARSIADYLKKERRSLGIETIYNYLAFLESAFVVYKVSRYDLRGKRLLETHEKYYLADIGLRHALLGYREGDIGIFLENIVYIELRKRGYGVQLGKWDDLEIDFVATRQGAAGTERLYIQVCYLLADAATREREYRPLRLVADNYPKLVLTLDPIPPGNDEGIERRFLPEWLLEEN
jgi:predicted AAA+ superfamily ATPase